MNNDIKIKDTILLKQQLDVAFIEDYEELSRQVKALKALGHKIVLTQGTYDMFHTGHTRYLRKGRDEGEVLIVAVDDDALTKARKGEDRPFDEESERYEMLRNLRSVNVVVPKRLGDHRYDVIKAVEPDVLVVSMSTGPEIQNEINELKKLCGELINIPPQSSNSTTAKLRRLKKDGGKELAEKITKTIEGYFGDVEVKK
jgi:rfaE bifunctional protein nucleotidyltransferase chain/domain